MLSKETLIPVTRAAQFCPGRPAGSTMCRWCIKGVKGVRLESLRIGGKRMTSGPAVKRFLAALNAEIPTPAEADSELSAAGL